MFVDLYKMFLIIFIIIIFDKEDIDFILNYSFDSNNNYTDYCPSIMLHKHCKLI